MRIVETGKYLHLYPEDGERVNASRFLGWRQERHKPYVTIEDNLVNEIILEMDAEQKVARDLKYPEGLKDYQVADVQKMVSVGNVLNRNPMGLGKTVEAITTMKELGTGSSLIVLPKIVGPQWRDQISKWWPARGKDVVLYQNNRTKVPEGSIVLINYEKLLNEATLNKLRMFRWDMLCADEAHKIKNPKSQRTLALKAIPAQRRVALTGTPILNKPDDLWSILHFLDWRYSGISYWNFVNYFCEINEDLWGRKPVGLTRIPERVVVLRRLLDRVSVYNPLSVAQGKTRNVVKLEMSPKQKKLYKDMRDLALDELPENARIANGAVLTTRVIQATSWPGLFIEGEAGPKFEWIQYMCEDYPERKLVVFTRFEKTARGLGDYLSKSGVASVQLTGAIPDKQREDNKQRFIKDDKVQVLIGTIAAMGQGTDGLQEVCNNCIFIDRDWSPEIMEQCEDRLNRYGQKYPVFSYILECEHSFDQYVGRINQHKADDIREALKNED